MLELANVGSVEKEVLLGTCEKSLMSETLVISAAGAINISGPDLELSLNENNPVLLPAGTYLLSNQAQLGHPPCQLIFIYLSVSFVTQLIEKYGSLFNRENNTQINKFNRPHIRNLLEQAIILIANNIVGKSAANAYLIALKVEEIFLLMLSQPQGEQFERTLKRIGSQASRKLRRFMNEHYRKNWSLEQFALQFNTSLSSFKSLFSKVYKTTPKAWINEMRLQYAYNQLVNTDKSIIDIALDSGFNSQSYFTQLYRKRFNQTPSHSRQKLGRKNTATEHRRPPGIPLSYPNLAMTA